MTTPPNGNGNGNGGYVVGSLEARVDSLERGAVTTQERQRFPWTVVVSAFGLLLGIVTVLGGVVMYGLNANFVHDRQDIDRIEGGMTALTTATVPRGEHEERWRAEDAAVTNLQRQIDAMNANFGSAYTLNDTLKGLQSRLDRLEELRLAQSKVVTP